MTTRLILLAFALLVIWGAAKKTQFPTQHPTIHPTLTPKSGATNFVILLADDLGFNDVNYYGGAANTKNISDLASSPNSFRFDNFHSGSSTCSPTRAALITGRHPERDCVPGVNRFNWFPIRLNITSIGTDASVAGYRTGFFGKWHLGPFQNRPPTQKGFQYYIGSEDNLITYDAPCSCNLETCLQTKCRNKNMCAARPCRAKQSCWLGCLTSLDEYHDTWQCNMDSGGLSLPISYDVMPRYRMSADFLAEKFEEFVATTPPTTPLLAYVAFNEPHQPFIADPVRREQCENSDLICNSTIRNFSFNSRNSNYFGVIISEDDAVGRIVTALRNANRLENTFLLFNSDNGPETPDRGGAGSSYPYRGYKRDLTEGGHHVAGILHWPAKIQRNTVITSLVSSLDLRATILDILKMENPLMENYQIERQDGESFLPMILASDPTRWNRTKAFAMCSCILDGTPSNAVCQQMTIYNGDMKLIANKNQETGPSAQLYNIALDKAELNDLASTNQDMVQKLGAQALAFRQDVSNEFWINCPALRKGTLRGTLKWFK